ncbi:MAG: methyltransferase domain-containing protein [Bacteroidota bacterium]
MRPIPNEQHNIEIHENKKAWDSKPLLRKIYFEFYNRIKQKIDYTIPGSLVELGSGLGNIKHVIPDVITTDIFPNPWIDKVESAYNLSFKDHSVANLILFDVFHHIEYPLAALKEFNRVLTQGGRIIIFDPDMSVFGMFVYGALHHEPVGVFKKINHTIPDKKALIETGYYAAQGNANRFFRNHNINKLEDWEMISRERFSDLSYVLSGGYGKPAMYPEKWLGPIKKTEKILNYLPFLFSTRMMVVLKKI